MTQDTRISDEGLQEAFRRKQLESKRGKRKIAPADVLRETERVPGIEEKLKVLVEERKAQSLDIVRKPSETLIVEVDTGPGIVKGPPAVGDVARRLVKELRIGNQFKNDIKRLVEVGGVGLISREKGLFDNLADNITGRTARERPSRDAVAAVLKKRLTKDAYLRFLSLPGFEAQFKDEIFREGSSVSDRDIATFITLKANRNRRFTEQAIRIGAQEFLIVGPAVSALKRTFQSVFGRTSRRKFTDTFQRILKEETGAIEFTPTRTRPDVRPAPFDPATYDPFSPDRAPDEITRTVRRVRRTFDPDIPGIPEPSVRPRTRPDPDIVPPKKTPEKTAPLRRTETSDERRARRSAERRKEDIRKERAAKELKALSETLSVPEPELAKQLGIKVSDVPETKPAPATKLGIKPEAETATPPRIESDPATITDTPTRLPATPPRTPPPRTPPPGEPPTKPPPTSGPPGRVISPKRFELPDGSKLAEGRFPLIVEFPLGVSIMRINLQTGRRTFRENPNPTADPVKGFKIVSFTSEPPRKRTLDQGIVDIRVKPTGIDFIASKRVVRGLGIKRRRGL